MDHIEQRMLQVGLRSTLPRIGSRAAMAWVLSNWHDWPEKFQRVVTLEVFDSLLRGQIEDESLREDWNDMLEAFLEDPQQMTNHLAFGMSLEQRREARGKNDGRSTVPTLSLIPN